jgi:DNA topoisomerase-3
MPSKLGIVLVQGYHRIDSSLVLPRVRSDIEDQCNNIAKGLATKEDVIRKAIALFEEKFDGFVSLLRRVLSVVLSIIFSQPLILYPVGY